MPAAGRASQHAVFLTLFLSIFLRETQYYASVLNMYFYIIYNVEYLLQSNAICGIPMWRDPSCGGERGDDKGRLLRGRNDLLYNT